MAALIASPSEGLRIPQGIDRLTAAAMIQIARRGVAGASARSVAAEAGAAASAINYKFGGLEQLYCAAFEAAAALSNAWSTARLAELALLPQGPDGAAIALEHVISAWTREARGLALLYQEALAHAPIGEPSAAWTRGWRDLWLQVAETVGLDPVDGALMHLFFQSEALYHLSPWAPALEPAALSEMCRHFAAVYLGGTAHAPTRALLSAEAAAGVIREGETPAAALKLVEAATEIVEESGLAGLTHRAVAARAGVTTGAVTHHFRTVENLVAGMIRGQVTAMSRSNAPGGGAASHGPLDLDMMFEGIRAYVVTDRPWGPTLRRRHIFLATLRRADLAASGAVIRFAHGATTSELLARLFDMSRAERSLYAGVLSRLTSASWQAASGEARPREAQTALINEVERRLAANLAA